MSPHFYVNSLVLFPPRKWWVARKKVQTQFYIACSRHTLYRYILYLADSFVRRSFPNFWIGTTNIFLRKLFPQFLFVIFCTWVLVQISDVSQEKGCGHCILRPDTNSYVLPKHLAFEDGWVPCGGKTVSTRAHIRKVQHYLHKTTLQTKLCS